jgi:hypothetical protein
LLISSDVQNAYDLLFYDGGENFQNYDYRYNGFSVRAVAD